MAKTSDRQIVNGETFMNMDAKARQDISEMSQDLSGLSQDYSDFKKPLLVNSELKKGKIIDGYWVNTSGSLVEYAQGSVIKIPVPANTDYISIMNPARCDSESDIVETELGGLLFVDFDNNAILRIGNTLSDYAAQDSVSGKWYINLTNIPDDAAFLYITAKLGTTWDVRDSIIIKYNTGIEIAEQSPNNILNACTVSPGYWVNTSDNVVSYDQGKILIIPVDLGTTKISVFNPLLFTDEAIKSEVLGGICFRNSNHEKISGISPDSVKAYSEIYGVYYCKIDIIPQNTAEIVITCALAKWDVSESMVVIKNSDLETPFGGIKNYFGLDIIDPFARVKIANLEKRQGYAVDYSDLTWALIGDSLTQKNYRAYTAYYDYIHDATGVQYINKALSGRGYVSTNYYFKTEIQQLINEAAEFDFCTIFGSGNDLSEANWPAAITATDFDEALGEASDTGNDTICGAINQTIDLFLDNFPTKKLGIITPTPWEEYCNPDGTITGTRMDKYTNKIIEICKRRGIPCLDLYHNSGMRPWDADYRAEYYVERGVVDTPATHPNSLGHKWLAPMFLRFIQQFLIDIIP